MSRRVSRERVASSGPWILRLALCYAGVTRCVSFGRSFLLFALAGHAAEPAVFQPPASPRAPYNVNAAWKFIRADVPDAAKPDFDDSAWTSVSSPHTWNEVDS